ncbi:MAG: UDP-N-acetylglucosamine--N-acetylmuramyl-(pentapeptide) pyrophosphoryl-undecaprenol N-acetylglucosamine transferase [Bacteroidia bacterium]|nr:UDP-N-acetylglucosamine--N-acetylmuramyl-(pentapeptide) pyrophosphoryl-undecaprenol N-acetylglucosamine transferase [Bacteroidia bacterium]
MALVIAAGGTGGHVFPALAVAEAWRRRWREDPIYWVGVRGGREEKWVSDAQFPFYGIPAAGWQPRFIWRNLSLLYRLPQGFWALERLMRHLKPQAILSTGGYPGFLPGLWAILHRRPLYLLELNRHAGRTVRWLGRFAAHIFASFPQTEGITAEWIGAPVRFSEEDRHRYTPHQAKTLWGLPAEQPTILVLGGSQGSSTLNKAVFASLPSWIQAGASVLWQVGRDAPEAPYPQVRTVSFIEDMARAYAAADIVVSRAGGSTLGELAWWGKAVVLVPSPYVAEDHQRKNASFWASHHAALVVQESHPSQLTQAVLELLHQPDQREKLAQAAHALSRPHAAEALAEYLHQALYGSA